MKPPFTLKRIQQALSGSLGRLSTDYVDIYLFHEFDQSILIEEALYAMTLAVHSGDVRAIGCSNFTVRQLNASENISKHYDFVRFEVVQPVYNILSREIESRLLPYCQKNKIGVMSYSPLAAGFLTGKYTQDLGTVPQGSRFSLVPGHRDLYCSPRNFAILQKLKRLADDNQTTMSRLALGWVLRNTRLDSILIGVTSVSHVSNAIEALLTRLDSGLVEEMDRWGILPNSAD